MKLPRDLSGMDLARALGQFGYEITRQTGSHIRLSRTPGTGHHLTIPAHHTLKIGTLSAILTEVAANLETTKAELVKRLFDD
ncbi:MAG: type II toxin-antitoxin system HicA family toxin [Gammaproteobacteria bacterium]